MTVFTVSLTNHMIILTQYCDSSHHVAEANCPSWPTHLLLLHNGRQHRSSSIPGVTWWQLYRILATDVSFEHERIRKDTGTSTTPTAETHWTMHTQLCTHFPLVTWA